MAHQDKLTRGLGLLEATALNMSNMVGVGPFVTIPLMIGAMGGPQCMLGWAVGAVLALCDGLVWAELAAAMEDWFQRKGYIPKGSKLILAELS